MSEKFTKVNDSGARQSFDTGSVRDLAEGKGRYDLIPPYPMQRLAEHFENGAKKYGDRNWEKGQPLMRYIDSATRHLIKGIIAGDRSEDHFSALIWNIMCYEHTLNEIEAGRLPKELDDRPDRMKPGVAVVRSAADLPKVARLRGGYVAYVGVWESGGCAWCGMKEDRNGKLYVHNNCEDKIPRHLFPDLVAACAAGSKVL